MNERLSFSPAELERLRHGTEGEISLIDLLLVAARRKWMMVGTALVVLAGAVAYASLRMPMYESRAVLAVGGVGGSLDVPATRLESPQELVQRLREAYAVGDSSEGAREPPFVDSVEVEKGSSAVVIRVRDFTPQGAQEYAGRVAQQVLSEHNPMFAQAVAAQRARFDSLTRQLEALDEQIATLAEHIDDVRKIDPAQAAILAVEKGQLLVERPGLEQQRADLAIALSTLRSQPTRMLRDPTRPVEPAGPGLGAYFALGAAAGVLLGVLAAFFAELVARARREFATRAD